MKQEDRIFKFYKSKLDGFNNELFDALSKNKTGHPAQFYWRDEAVISTRDKVLNLNDVKIKTRLFSNLAYENKEDAIALFDKISQETSKENIISLVIPGNSDFDFSQYGYETAIEHYVYNFATSLLPQFDVEGIILDPSPASLLKMYEHFTEFFTGYFNRTEDDFTLMISTIKSMGGSVVALKNEGYVVFIRHQSHVEVLELVYDRSATLLKLLSFVSRGMRRVVYRASESEQIQKVLPEANRTKEIFMLAKVHDRELFERLFHIKILSAYSAFRAFAKPVFNRDFF